MPKIFLLEDDSTFGTQLKLSLELSGYSALLCPDVRTAQRKIKEGPFDLLILDWNLPDGTGFDFVKSVTEEIGNTPLLFLTARDDEDTAVRAFSVGAGDYIRKTVGQTELLARIKRLLNEAVTPNAELRFGDLLLDVKRRAATLGGVPLTLNRRGFEILEHLVKRGDSVVAREELLEKIDSGSEIFDRTIDAHVSQLRARLKASGVHTVKIASVYGVGYRLERAAK